MREENKVTLEGRRMKHKMTLEIFNGNMQGGLVKKYIRVAQMCQK